MSNRTYNYTVTLRNIESLKDFNDAAKGHTAVGVGGSKKGKAVKLSDAKKSLIAGGYSISSKHAGKARWKISFTSDHKLNNFEARSINARGITKWKLRVAGKRAAPAELREMNQLLEKRGARDLVSIADTYAFLDVDNAPSGTIRLNKNYGWQTKVAKFLEPLLITMDNDKYGIFTATNYLVLPVIISVLFYHTLAARMSYIVHDVPFILSHFAQRMTGASVGTMLDTVVKHYVTMTSYYSGFFIPQSQFSPDAFGTTFDQVVLKYYNHTGGKMYNGLAQSAEVYPFFNDLFKDVDAMNTLVQALNYSLKPIATVEHLARYAFMVAIDTTFAVLEFALPALAIIFAYYLMKKIVNGLNQKRLVRA